jgi:hypothetical protein
MPPFVTAFAKREILQHIFRIIVHMRMKFTKPRLREKMIPAWIAVAVFG